MPLANRQKQIPNGMFFYDAVLKWNSQRGASFSSIVDNLITARKANPGVTQAKGLATDRTAVENEVDAFLTAVCVQHGWNDFITGPGGAAVPFSQPQPPRLTIHQRSQAVAAGAKTILEWIASKEEAVPAEQSAKRAAVCADCEKNKMASLSDYFTAAAAEAIRQAMEVKNGWNLTTPSDDKLGVCQGCFCVNALSVHCPLDIKLKHMNAETFERLAPNCWCRTEKAA